MLKLNFEKEELLDAIDRVICKTMTMSMPWDWSCGVAYYGISQAYEKTKNEKYLNILIDRVDELIELGLPEFTVNTCAMGHVLITLYDATGNQGYWDIVMNKVEFLQHKALRFGEGVLQHTVSPNNDFPEQVWADTLFMAAFFMLRVGAKLNDEELIADALHQFYSHAKYLQDEESSLWYHGYSNVAKSHMSGIYWGRANAWAAYTMSQVKPHLKEWYHYPKCIAVGYAFRDQLEALKPLQTENGLWRTIIDDPESYEEVSAAAGIAAAMVESENPLYSKCVQKALTGILSNISETGRVLNVSGGTAVMRDKAGYREIPKDWIHGWGQGLTVTFLTAVL